MSNLNITPQRVLLSSGQAVTFHATNSAGDSVPVTWSHSPSIGGFSPAPPTAPSRSVTYVAPLGQTSALTIALVANAGDEYASATIDLTPYAVVVVPDKVELKAGQSQKFVAVVEGAPGVPPVAPLQPPVPQPAQPQVAGGPPPDPQQPQAQSAAPQPQGQGDLAGAAAQPQLQGQQPTTVSPITASVAGVTWVLSPEIGRLDETTGEYTAPEQINDEAAVTITAIVNGSRGQATASLIPIPWRGWTVNFLGLYLLLVFLLVFLLVGLWPPALPTPELAKADRLDAEKTLQITTKALEAAETAKKTSADLSLQAKNAAAAATTDTKKAQDASLAAAKEKTDSDAATQAQEEKNRAVDDLQQRRTIEDKVRDPYVETALVKRISREVDLLFVVLLAGALGAYLHASRSFSEFLGNERLKSSWAWWYCLAPFSGAILALVFYAAARGGILAINAGSTTKSSDLNPYAIATLSAIVGLFSKDATTKLGEVFKTLFQSDNAKVSKDQLKATPQPTPSEASEAAGTTAASLGKASPPAKP